MWREAVTQSSAWGLSCHLAALPPGCRRPQKSQADTPSLEQEDLLACIGSFPRPCPGPWKQVAS